MDVGVAQNHRQRFVAADLLDGWKINSGLHQFGDRSVPQNMGRDDLGVETRADDGIPKRLFHAVTMTGKTGAGTRRGEDPAFRSPHFHFSPQHVSQFRGDRLLAPAALGSRYLQPQFVKVDLLEPGAQNLPVPHRSVQAKCNEQPAAGIVVSQSALKQGMRLLVGQRNDATLFAFQQSDLAGRRRPFNPIRGPVAELVGIEVGVVSGVMNLESSGVEASDWRPRHEEVYHDA